MEPHPFAIVEPMPRYFPYDGFEPFDFLLIRGSSHDRALLSMPLAFSCSLLLRRSCFRPFYGFSILDVLSRSGSMSRCVKQDKELRPRNTSRRAFRVGVCPTPVVEKAMDFLVELLAMLVSMFSSGGLRQFQFGKRYLTLIFAFDLGIGLDPFFWIIP